MGAAARRWGAPGGSWDCPSPSPQPPRGRSVSSLPSRRVPSTRPGPASVAAESSGPPRPSGSSARRPFPPGRSAGRSSPQRRYVARRRGAMNSPSSCRVRESAMRRHRPRPPGVDLDTDVWERSPHPRTAPLSPNGWRQVRRKAGIERLCVRPNYRSSWAFQRSTLVRLPPLRLCPLMRTLTTR